MSTLAAIADLDRRLLREPVSLDEPLKTAGGEEVGAVADLIGAEDPAFQNLETKRTLMRIMNCLSDREVAVLTLRYFAGWRLEEVGHVFQLSRQRIQQIEATAVKKMREAARPPVVEPGKRGQRRK